METLHSNKVKASIYCLNDDSRTTVAWAEEGLGIGIVPKSIIDNSDKNIEFYELDEDELKTQISIVWMKNEYLPRSARNLLDMIRDYKF